MSTKSKSKTLGIDLLSPLAEYIGKVITQVVAVDQNKDGKISGIEIARVGQSIAMDSFQAFAGLDWPTVKAQASDLDEQEIKTLAGQFATKFDIASETAELLIESWLEHLALTANLAIKTIKLLGSKRLKAA